MENNLQLVKITNNQILDTNSKENIEKFKNNLRYLIEYTKQHGKIDKFMIIRDDNFFPYDLKWRVSSKDTGYEKTSLTLSTLLKKEYALKQAGIKQSFNGFNMPINQNELQSALSKVDKDFGKINVPVSFRSTKHFTVNTPLESTFSYNQVDANRNFTIIDNIDSFLKSGYGYSISYRDAYLDITHEDLPISNSAIILIEKSKYENIINNPKIKEELNLRRVVVYTGDEDLAINMILSELGVLPSKVGNMYIEYDEQINKILEESIMDLASKNNLLYDKSHGGSNGHFSDFYDNKNKDINKSVSNFVDFLKEKFKEESNLISGNNINDIERCNRFIKAVGLENLIDAINIYNSNYEKQFIEGYNNYKINRDSITPEISSIFKVTFRKINDYYLKNQKELYDMQTNELIEKNICDFFQQSRVEEQLIAAKKLWNIFNIEYNNSYTDIESSKIQK